MILLHIIDLLIFDGQAKSDKQSLEIAQKCDMLILPTSPSLDDLEPCIRLAHDLKKNNIDPSKICFARTGTGQSQNDDIASLEYSEKATLSGYQLLEGSIPSKTSIRKALDLGHSPSEIPYHTVKSKVFEFTQSVVNTFQKIIS